MTRHLALSLALCLGAAVASADTITSTAAGGPWSEPATWEGGAVPTAADAVILAGPVTVNGTAYCQELDVLPTGALAGAFAGPSNMLVVDGSVANEGTITNGSFNFFLEIGGDLHNAGVWANHQTGFAGLDDRHLSHAESAPFATDLVMAPGAAGDAVADTPLTVQGDVDMTGGRLVLGPGCHFTLVEGKFSGDLAAGGNEMRFVSWSYLDRCTLDDVVLVGEVEAAILVSFTTRVTVKGVLQNLSSTGGSQVTVHGELINHGTIQNDNYGFVLNLHGDLENHGAITCSQVVFHGLYEHRLAMGPDAVIDAFVFLPEFQAATLVAETPVRFAEGLGLGVGTLVLEPGSSLTFTDFGGVGTGTILAGGNEIRVEGTGGISGVTIDQGVLAGQVALHDAIQCTGGLTVTGTLTSWQWDSAEITVSGLLRNEGTITDGAHPVTITALGDLENLGAWDNARVTMAGAQDQFVGAGEGLAVAAFELASGLSVASYQWYRDGEALPGENGPSLTLAGVSAADYGRYHCEGGGEVSRAVVVAEGLVTTDVPPSAGVLLAQNHPNPFNPATTIEFVLVRDDRVRLAVYDLAGREVDVLVDHALGAGRHQVEWRPRNVASGVFVYRLQAGSEDLMRKCTLLK